MKQDELEMYSVSVKRTWRAWGKSLCGSHHSPVPVDCSWVSWSSRCCGCDSARGSAGSCAAPGWVQTGSAEGRGSLLGVTGAHTAVPLPVALGSGLHRHTISLTSSSILPHHRGQTSRSNIKEPVFSYLVNNSKYILSCKFNAGLYLQ